jgi:CubicO group peptidase (beta-lactamase class C family)
MGAMTTDTSPTTRRTKAHPPGTTYKYGPSHHVVAGAWLEKAFGESWDELLARFVREPLGIDVMQYVSAANLAGSIYASVADYSRFVEAQRADAQGTGPRRLLSREALEQQHASQARFTDPSLAWLISPQSGFDYGLNTYRWCARAYTEAEVFGPLEELQGLIDPTCDEVFIIGHGGKGGYNPFIEATGRYSAVFAMREDSPGEGDVYTGSEVGITTQVRLLVHLAMTK